MRFWDTSALVPLCLIEPESPRIRPLLEADAAVVVWWATRTECISALMRREREGQVTARTTEQARAVVNALARAWTEILPGEAVRDRAERLLGVHTLRSADAFQLASALLWSRGRTGGHDFVVLDERLRSAAAREGFRVRP